MGEVALEKGELALSVFSQRKNISVPASFPLWDKQEGNHIGKTMQQELSPFPPRTMALV